MFICINLAALPVGGLPTLELFREVSEVDTSAYNLKSRLPKRVKQMQCLPLLFHFCNQAAKTIVVIMEPEWVFS